jgi:hypothetical protein
VLLEGQWGGKADVAGLLAGRGPRGEGGAVRSAMPKEKKGAGGEVLAVRARAEVGCVCVWKGRSSRGARRGASHAFKWN